MRFLSCFLLLISLFGCNNSSNTNTLVVGTISGPETDLILRAKEVAENKYGLKIQIREFNDYNLPNEALQDGSLDVNVYQHLPYLKAAMLAHSYNFEVIGKTFVYPMGIYSKKYKSLDELPAQSIIAIPNDPSNETRALLLLAKAHLITLKDENKTVPEILENPKQFQFKEMDAAQLPRVLTDVSAAVINTTFALPAGLSPAKNALFSEGKDSPYANLIVVLKDSKKKEQLLLWVKALNSEEVKEKGKELFGDAAIAAWESN